MVVLGLGPSQASTQLSLRELLPHSLRPPITKVLLMRTFWPLTVVLLSRLASNVGIALPFIAVSEGAVVCLGMTHGAHVGGIRLAVNMDLATECPGELS